MRAGDVAAKAGFGWASWHVGRRAVGAPAKEASTSLHVMEHVEGPTCNEPTLPTRHVPEHLSFGTSLRLGYGIMRMRFVRQTPGRVNYEASLRLLDRPLLRALAEIGALSAPSLAEVVNRAHMIETHSVSTGIHSMTTDTARDWLTSAWRRGLVSTMPEMPSGCLLDGPLWTLTKAGQGRLRSPAIAAVTRLPWLRVVSTVIVGGSSIYAWINSHANTAGVVFIWLTVMTLYALGLWLLVRMFEAREAPVGLVAIETHRARGTLPPLLDASPG